MRAFSPPDVSANARAEPWDVSPADPTGPRFRIEDIYPSVDGGRYPVKRVAGEIVDVWADIFREGHDVITASLLWRPDSFPRPCRQLHNRRLPRLLFRRALAVPARTTPDCRRCSTIPSSS